MYIWLKLSSFTKYCAIEKLIDVYKKNYKIKKKVIENHRYMMKILVMQLKNLQKQREMVSSNVAKLRMLQLI